MELRRKASPRPVESAQYSSEPFQRLMADIYETVKDKAQTRQRISAEARAAAQAYLAQFDSVADAIKVLRAVAK